MTAIPPTLKVQFETSDPHFFPQKFGLEEEILENSNENIFSDNSDIYLFPSVTRGHLNVEKVGKSLEWTPTEWNVALKEITAFYLEEVKNYREEIEDILSDFVKDLGLKKTDMGREFKAKVRSDYAKKVKSEL